MRKNTTQTKCDGCDYNDDMCVCMTDCPRKEKQITNYDYIMNMSLEEMAVFIEDVAQLAKNTRCTMGVEERTEWLKERYR